MEKFIIWPEVLDWYEIRRVFVILSVIGVCVSCGINRYLKYFPVLAIQLSILFSLAVYPMINFYTLMSSNYDVFEVTGRANPSHYGALVFLAPLPACILTAATFFIFRNRRTDKKTFRQLGKSKLLMKIVSCVLSLTIGSVWLSISMLFEKGEFHTTVAIFIFYTILGFIMYLASEVVLLVVKQLMPKSNEDNSSI